MRFLHTADWHLGRIFHQVHLTGDQDHILRQVLDIARHASVDALVLAGDVYDRAVPPPEAVRLLDDLLAELLLDLRIPVIVAAGNHDSPERLAFGARLLAARGLHLFGVPSASPAPVVLHDAHGPVAFHVAPYAEPPLVRERLNAPEAVDHDSAMRALVASMLAAPPALAHPPAHPIAQPPGAGAARTVFIGHAFVQGGAVSDSERPLSVGGAGTIGADALAPFSFAALGHLHRPQDISARIHYAGAPLKYSFDEVGQHRSVSIVEMDVQGACTIERVTLTPRRELRRIEGTLDALLAPASLDASRRDDYIVARLTDPHPVLDPIGRLRKIYPNVLCIERLPANPVGELQTAGDRRQLDHRQLFAGFFKEMTGEPPTAEQLELFLAIAGEVAGRDREVMA